MIHPYAPKTTPSHFQETHFQETSQLKLVCGDPWDLRGMQMRSSFFFSWELCTRALGLLLNAASV